MFKSIAFIAFLFLVGMASCFAQVGCFTILPDSLGCAPFKVNVINCFTVGQPVSYNVDLARAPNGWFQADLTLRGDTSHTYTQAGIYVLAQAPSGQFRNPFKRQIHIFDQNSKPVFKLGTCQNLLQIHLKDTIFKRYKITVNGSTSFATTFRQDTVINIPFAIAGADSALAKVQIAGIYPAQCGNTLVNDSIFIYGSNRASRLLQVRQAGTSPNFTYDIDLKSVRGKLALLQIKDLNSTVLSSTTFLSTNSGQRSFQFALSTDSLVFRIADLDACPVPSPPDSLFGFKPIVVQTGLLVSGTIGAFPTNFIAQVLKNGTERSNSNPPLAWQDSLSAQCGVQDCFQYVFAQPSNPDKAFISSPVCLSGAAAGSAKLPTYTTSSFADGAFQLGFVSPSPIQSLASSSVPFSAFTPGKSFSFKVALPYVQASPCFTLTFLDSCGNTSPLPMRICAPLLRGTATDKGDAQLSWQTPLADDSISSAIGDTLTSRGQTGQMLNTIELLGKTSFTDRSKYPDNLITYSLAYSGTDAGFNFNFRSNPVAIQRNPLLIIPTAFSPNDDGSNDKLKVYQERVNGFKIKIYNKWGEIVFATENVNFAWDGRFKGSVVPFDTYNTVVEYRDQSGKNYKRRTTLTILN